MRIATKTALAFAAFAVVCVGGSGLLLLEESHAALVESLREKQKLLVTNRALVLRENLGLATGEIERLTGMAEIDLEDGDLRPEQRLLAQAYRQTSFFNGRLELYGRHGRCRWAEPEADRCLARDASHEAWFRGTMAEARTTHVYVSEPDGRGLVDLVAPVRRGGVTVGVLRGVVDLQQDLMFSPALREDLPDSTRVALVRGDGRAVIQSPDVDWSEPMWREALAAVESGRSGTALVSGASETQLVAWTPVGRAELGLIFAWPLEALDDAAERHVRGLVTSIATVGALALLLGFVVARLLTRPLQRLAVQVRSIREGALRTLPPTSRRDEIGEVRRAYAALLAELTEREAEIRTERDRIAELAVSLEDRVDERTRELEETRDALVTAERMAAIGRAAAVLSHELRNTLNAVSVAMDTLAADESEDSKRNARRLVRAEVARLRTLSDDLLVYAKEPRLERLEASVVELLELAELVVDEHARSHGVTLRVAVEGQPTATVDPDRIQTVLVNLLRNAVDAAASGSEEHLVRVAAAVDGDDLRIEVEDSGPGVDEDVRERLFQPFVTSRRQGLGLGLAIAERFVRAHGGSIELEESALGGARFVVRLPCQPDAA